MSSAMVRTNVPGVYKRGDSFVATWRDADKKQHKRTASTQAEAERIRVMYRGGRGEKRKRFAAFAQEWVRTYRGRTKRGIRANTLADYRRALGFDDQGEFLRDGNELVGTLAFFGHRWLDEIGPQDILRYAGNLEEQGLAPSSVRKLMAPLKALFATAFEQQLVRVNPAAGLRIIPVRKQNDTDEGPQKVKALSEDELRAVLEALPLRWRLFFEFLAHTGLRIGEAIALRWSDVEVGKRRVHVRRRFYRGGFAPPKSEHGRRVVPLSEGLARQLWRLGDGRELGDALVFTSESGAMIDTSNLMSRTLKPAAVKAGLGEWVVGGWAYDKRGQRRRRRHAHTWVGFHTFRHTCATILFRHGLSPKQVQVWLGHHSAGFTLNTYVHLLPEDLPTPSFLDDLTGGREQEATDGPATTGNTAVLEAVETTDAQHDRNGLEAVAANS